jgi:hypothetical protein
MHSTRADGVLAGMDLWSERKRERKREREWETRYMGM